MASNKAWRILKPLKEGASIPISEKTPCRHFGDILPLQTVLGASKHRKSARRYQRGDGKKSKYLPLFPLVAMRELRDGGLD